MRIVIVGGGIAAAYMANAFKEHSPEHEIMIVSKESNPPYDRIHLCSLVNGSANIRDIALKLPSSVRLELDSEVIKIDKDTKRIKQQTEFIADKMPDSGPHQIGQENRTSADHEPINHPGPPAENGKRSKGPHDRRPKRHQRPNRDRRVGKCMLKSSKNEVIHFGHLKWAENSKQ